MVDTRSPLLIDDGIDINVLNAARDHHSHHFDENPLVLRLLPSEHLPRMTLSGHCEDDVSML